MEELKKQYEELLKKIGIFAENKLTDENGKINLFNKRWILMDVEAFPEYMIESTASIMGRKMAEEFVYWFGYGYGEKVVERYLKAGLPREMIPNVVAATSTLFTGWGSAEILEFSLERGTLIVRIYNDFESESATLSGHTPTNNFLRGVLAGAFSKLIGAKTHAIAEFKDGLTVISVRKREKTAE